MISLSKILVFLALISSLTACVTTREQYNEEHGIHADSEAPSEVSRPPHHPVQSEDLPTRANRSESASSVPATPSAFSSETARSSEARESAASPSVSAAAPPTKDVSSYASEELRAEVAKLTGEVEELKHEKELNEKGKTQEDKKAQERIVELEKKLKELQPDAPKVPEGKTPVQAAKDAFSNANLDDAVLFASQALEKSDTGKEAEEATYIRGEAYFKKQQFNKAIVDFSHFPEKFQKSAYHPKALLRIAESFELMGRKDDAKAFYSDLLDKFPKTAEGKLAKKRLKLKK